MNKPKKWETVRVVTFLKDFMSKEITKDGKVIKPAKVLYKKGRQVAMTLKLAKKLQERNAEIKIAEFDRAAATKRQRKIFEEANKRKTELMYMQP